MDCRRERVVTRVRGRGGRSLGRSRLGTNPRPAPRTATAAAGNERGDHASRGATVAGEERNTARQRAHGGSLVSSQRRANDGSPVSSRQQARGRLLQRQQAHGAVFSSDQHWRRRSDGLRSIPFYRSLLRPCGYALGSTGRRGGVLASSLSLVGCCPAGCLGQHVDSAFADQTGPARASMYPPVVTRIAK